MRHLIMSLMLLLAVLGLSTAAEAQTATCDALSGAKRGVAQAVLNSQHPYDCCDGTIAACLKKPKPCRLARRLANQVCRMAKSGKSQADIERALARRAASMGAGGKKYNMDLSVIPPAGSAGAKVTLVAYLCARCPYCARLTPHLYRSVTSGKLKGKVKFYVRPFPIRSHTHSTEGGMAMMAANKLGKFWEMLLHMYAHFKDFDPAKLPDCAASKGMNREQFVKLMGDKALRNKLVDSKKEGVRNKVDATPTLFINGRKYTGNLDAETVEDVLEEEYDRLTGKQRD
jgi:protein-disulfide isomerase